MKMLRVLWLALLFSFAAANVSADDGRGLDNQPQTPDAVARQMNAAMNQYTMKGGDVAQARPDLLLLVEANAPTDFAYFITPVFRDRTTYEGIVDTLEEAYTKADVKTKPFILYNLVRVHEIRADVMPEGTARKPYLDAARKAAARFDKIFQDPGLWKVKGDVESDAGNVDAAIANYKKIATTGSGTPATAQYNIGWAYLRARRFPEAEAAFKDGIRADAASTNEATKRRGMRHLLYQALLSLYLQKNDYAQAATALTESVRGIKAEPPPFYLLPYGAEELLKRSSYAKVVLDYANAALALNPDAPGMADLRDKAVAAIKSRMPRPR